MDCIFTPFALEILTSTPYVLVVIIIILKISTSPFNILDIYLEIHLPH